MKHAFHAIPALLLFVGHIFAQGVVETPRIESVVPAKTQPYEKDKAVIFYDNFDGPPETQNVYLEPNPGSANAKRSTREALGGDGMSMECYYASGGQGVGNRKLVFGDCPFGKPVRKGERFEDVYWRIYVKHQKGWQGGGPAKMSRATGFVSNRWNQAFITHVWGSGSVLTLDPVSGVRQDKIVTTKYNDFDQFRWLGNQPNGKFPIHTSEESGRWVCVEARMKLNTPGKKDGSCALWIDGRLDTERAGLDFRGAYDLHTINAIFLEAYWNEGSLVDQYRWYDDFVVSTKPIGPLVAEANPTLIKMDDPACVAWEVEISIGPEGRDVVWKSNTLETGDNRLTVGSESGVFMGKAAGRTSLAEGFVYFCSVRRRCADGAWSDWSGRHQPFRVSASR